MEFEANSHEYRLNRKSLSFQASFSLSRLILHDRKTISLTFDCVFNTFWFSYSFFGKTTTGLVFSATGYKIYCLTVLELLERLRMSFGIK